MCPHRPWTFRVYTGCLRVSFSSDADRHADLSGSPLKSKSTRKPLACIIGYLGGYFLIEEKLGEKLTDGENGLTFE